VPEAGHDLREELESLAPLVRDQNAEMTGLVVGRDPLNGSAARADGGSRPGSALDSVRGAGKPSAQTRRRAGRKPYGPRPIRPQSVQAGTPADRATGRRYAS
jgi:hypothetical protein